MRRRDADIPSSFQVREKGQVHQHPQRGWSQRQGEDSGVRRDQEAGRLPLPQLVRGGALDWTSQLQGGFLNWASPEFAKCWPVSN